MTDVLLQSKHRHMSVETYDPGSLQLSGFLYVYLLILTLKNRTKDSGWRTFKRPT